MKRSFRCLLFTAPLFLLLAGCQKTITSDTGSLKITFRNMVGNSPMALDGTVYTNPFNETYTVTKFRYYVSNVHLNGTNGSIAEKDSYHLVDQSLPNTMSFSFGADENTFSGLSFLIGVDSIRNVSGAQTGALDPLNDMFWTWNSGYVMAKMEGTSPLSNQAGNMIEYHIGGFSGENNVLKTIDLPFPGGKTVVIKAGQNASITISADFNKWWQNPNDLKIAEVPVCTTPGVMARKIADNYSKMFTVTDVVNN